MGSETLSNSSLFFVNPLQLLSAGTDDRHLMGSHKQRIIVHGHIVKGQPKKGGMSGVTVKNEFTYFIFPASEFRKEIMV